ncbi:hypothetical protein RHMOL_Rhmol04G0117800 [Rhododendron molle]|uniref:Uncharacterized protein n=1 Tax=Rhododendron molle TaxID=49168 RepID=A0ACC0P0K7_RHOML|nr:hypothetical protein RHMOL_Rhmol04G0117800 [Rhododendron molle]
MKAAAELVFIPLPGIGHLVPTVEMAKQLVGRDHRLSITFLIMKIPLDKSKVSSSTQSLLLTAAEDRLKFVYLPQQEAALAELLSKNPRNFLSEFVNVNKQHVRDHVKKMMISTELTDSSRLAGFVVDMFCTPMMAVAAEFGLPTYAFVTSGCAFLGLMFHLETLNQYHNQDVTELKDSDAELEVPVFVNAVPAKVLPSMVLSEEEGSTFFMEISKRLRETEGIMVNTFEELESYAVKCLAKDDKVPPLQVREIAQALEQSGHRFLWPLRQPPPKGKFAIPGEYQEDLSQVLPEGFLERTTKIGKVIGWAQQAAVQSHKSVGCFVSHYGWNSTLESLWCRVPMATWPIYAEQQMNAFQLVRELGLAVEIKLDYRKDVETAKVNLVTANEIENGIRKLMENKDKSSEGIKQKVKEMSEKSKTAIEEGGSSYNYIERFFEVVMTNVHSP